MYRPKELMADFRRELGVSISYKVAWKAKQLALGIIHGDHAKSYGKFQSCCNKLVISNPGTMAHGQQTIEGRFCRMFLAFGACINGFSHCRDFIGLESTFLTSKYLGALLMATGIDAMGALFPIAFCVVDVENEDNWVWFLQNVHDCMTSVNALTFVSNKRKGLLPTVELVFPGCEHAYCMRHLDENFKKKCNNGEFIRLFWVAAYASTTSNYDEAILGMKAISLAAIEYLLSMSPPSHWATTHFKGKHYGHLTSNIAESLNSWLLEPRSKPIISMLDIIHHQLTTWFYAHIREGKKCPKLEKPAALKVKQPEAVPVKAITRNSRVVIEQLQGDEPVPAPSKLNPKAKEWEQRKSTWKEKGKAKEFDEWKDHMELATKITANLEKKKPEIP
ncbi:hypothetical protein L7F22_014329 [Adiantum nelumboides]|nr:hypothetical protein [Adiantum nelumboides]